MRENGARMSSQDNVKSLEEYPECVQELCRSSLEIREAAYAPYSNFPVGAALRTSSGEIVTGCNVENASYGLSICAERTACVSAVSQGRKDFTAVAIAADLVNGEFCTPCGACRQFLAEFNPHIPIYLVRKSDRMVQQTDLEALLPQSFTPLKLKLKFFNGTSA